MLRAASKVSVGAVAPVGVARVKRLVQGELSVVAEAQVWRRLARVFIFAAGDAPVAGKAAPGETPVVRLTRLPTVANALERPLSVGCGGSEISFGGDELRKAPGGGRGGDFVDDDLKGNVELVTETEDGG